MTAPSDPSRDGAAATAAYDVIGVGYARHRREDDRIRRRIHAALGDSRTVLNVGAGTGSYEPRDRRTVAVEPSVVMLRQRPPHAAPAVRGDALRLPVRDRSVDAAMAVLTLHHWPDWRAGVHELLRVARRVVVLHFDPPVQDRFWLFRDYLPEVLELPAVREAPRVDELAAALGADSVTPVPVPADCADGFASAYWRRPERYLDPAVRRAISVFQQRPPAVVERAMDRLRRDLEDGSWHERHADLLEQEAFDAGLRLVVRSGAG